MRILVLGGTGFVGAPIVKRLADAGHDVTLFHRGVVREGVLQGDRNRLDESVSDLRRLRPDVVVDTIAFTQQQGESAVAAFRGITGRIVVLSSGDVYRANDILFRRVEGAIEKTPLTESSPLRERFYPYCGIPIPEAYGIHWDDYDKLLVERVMLNSAVPATVLRLPMVYGPGDEDGKMRRFQSYARRMEDGRPAILLDRRTAQWRAPWGYTENIAEAVRLAVENDRAAGEIYNVGEADSPDMYGWIRELAAILQWPGQLVIADEPCPPPNLPRHFNLDQHLDMDTTKIRAQLGYRETVPRREALLKTVAWDRDHPPRHSDPSQFDYAGEDVILERLR